MIMNKSIGIPQMDMISMLHGSAYKMIHIYYPGFCPQSFSKNRLYHIRQHPRRNIRRGWGFFTPWSEECKISSFYATSFLISQGISRKNQ